MFGIIIIILVQFNYVYFATFRLWRLEFETMAGNTRRLFYIDHIDDAEVMRWSTTQVLRLCCVGGMLANEACLKVCDNGSTTPTTQGDLPHVESSVSSSSHTVPLIPHLNNKPEHMHKQHSSPLHPWGERLPPAVSMGRIRSTTLVRPTVGYRYRYIYIYCLVLFSQINIKIFLRIWLLVTQSTMIPFISMLSRCYLDAITMLSRCLPPGRNHCRISRCRMPLDKKRSHLEQTAGRVVNERVTLPRCIAHMVLTKI